MNTGPSNGFIRFVPLVAAVAGCMLMIIARVLTNRRVEQYHQRIADESVHKMKSSNDPNRMDKLFDEVGDAVSSNPPKGEIPVIYSAVYLIGCIGLVATFFWGIVCLGWWAGALIFGLYSLTGFVPSLLRPKR
jgi:hypothetical protein